MRLRDWLNDMLVTKYFDNIYWTIHLFTAALCFALIAYLIIKNLVRLIKKHTARFREVNPKTLLWIGFEQVKDADPVTPSDTFDYMDESNILDTSTDALTPASVPDREISRKRQEIISMISVNGTSYDSLESGRVDISSMMSTGTKYNQGPESESFESDSVKSFAIFNNEYHKLEAAATAWDPVDMLAIPFQAAAKPQKSDKTPIDKRKNGRITKSQSVDFKGDGLLGLNGSRTSILHRVASDFSFGSRSSGKDADAVRVGTTNLGQSGHCQLLGMLYVKHVYEHSKRRRLTSFNLPRYIVRYLLQYIGPLIHETSIFKGTLFMNVDSLMEEFGPDAIVKTVRAISKRFPNHVLILDGGLSIFETVRDFIQGMVIRNSMINTDGTQRTRFGIERKEFDDSVKKLNSEMAIRDDFLVIDITVLEKESSPSLLKHYITWLQSHGFIGWTCLDSQYTYVADVKSLIPKEGIADDGIFELYNRPDVQKLVSAFSSLSVKEFNYNLDLCAASWASLLSEMQIMPALLSCFPSIGNVTLSECCAEAFEIPKRPSPGKFSWAGETDIKFNSTLPSLNASISSKRFTTEVSAKNDIPGGLYAFGQCLPPNGRVSAERQIVSVLKVLQRRNLLRNYRFIEPGTAVNAQIGESTPANTQFTALMSLLKSILVSPSMAAKHLLRSFDNDKAFSALNSLYNELDCGTVDIWLTNPNAFTIKNADDKDLGPSPVVFALVTDRNKNGTCDIFIRDDFPNVLGAVLHCYFKKFGGFSTITCVMAEALVVAQLQGDLDELPVPQRFVWQLERSSCQECGIYLLNTSQCVEAMDNQPTKKLEYEKKLCYFIDAHCQYLMKDLPTYITYLSSLAVNSYIPKNGFEQEMTLLVGKASLDQVSRGFINELCRTISKYIEGSVGQPFESRPLYQVAFRYFLSTFIKAIRRVAWEELEIVLLTKNAVILPDPDQVAVCLEMATTQSNMQRIFGLNSHQLSQIMHPQLRGRLEKAQPDPRGFAKEAELKVDIRIEKRATNAFLFVYPVVIDLLLMHFVGTGIFFSDKMEKEMQKMANLTFMIVFPISGGLMNSIGRVCSYYFFQRSIPLTITSFLRRLSMTIIIGTAASIASAVFFIALHGGTLATISSSIIGLAYSMSFVMYITFFSGIVCFRDEEEYLYESAGPLAILKSLLILAIPVPLVHQLDIPPLAVSFIYVGSLTGAWLWLAYAYFHASKSYMHWPKKIDIPSDIELQNEFAQTKPRPALDDDEDSRKYERRIKLWERAAREHYVRQVTDALSSTTKTNLSDIISRRCANYRREQLLMKYFLERNGVVDPPVKFSREWDMMLKQAVSELMKKNQVEKINRGDLLFEFEIPTVIFGILYFLLIFVDRWCVLFTTGEIIMYLPDILGKAYSTGIIWASVFLLVSSGFLEFALHQIAESERQIVSGRYGELKIHEMLALQQEKRIRDYRMNLVFFVKCMMCIFGLISVPLLVNHETMPQSTIIFAIATFGYVGFLLGLFHKLYLKANENRMNWALLVSIVAGLAVGMPLSIIQDAPIMAILCIPSSGWTFCLICVFLFLNDTMDSSNPQIPLSPELMSSGCHWIKTPASTQRLLARQELISILSTEKDLRQLRFDSTLGIEIQRILQNARGYYQKLPQNHRIRVAIPESDAFLAKAWDTFQNGTTLLYIKAQNYLACQGYNFAAVSSSENNTMRMYFAIPNDLDVNVGAYISELLLHEFVECAGLSHQQAVLFEILLTMSRKEALPARIKFQLDKQNPNTSRSMIVDENRIHLRNACFGVDLNKQWKKLDRESRNFFVRNIKSWRSMIANPQARISPGTADPFNEVISSETAGKVSLTKVITAARRENGLNENIDPVTLQAANATKSQLAMQVSEYCGKNLAYRTALIKNATSSSERIQMSGMDLFTNEQQTSSDDIPFFQRITLSIENFGRLVFLCFTNDVYYGKELHSMQPSWHTRYFLGALLWCARSIIKILTYIFVYSNEEDTKVLLHRAKHGAYRVLIPPTLKSPGRIDIPDSPHGPITCIFEIEPDAPGGMDGELCRPVIAHYMGAQPADFVPGAKDKPIMRSFFWDYPVPATRLSHTFTYSGTKIVSTAIYHYLQLSETFPVKRYIYDGMVSVAEEAKQDTVLPLREIHEFEMKTHNLVANATLFRDIKEKRYTIKALYTYNAEDNQDPYLTRVDYIQNDHEMDPWCMTVTYSGTVSRAVRHVQVDMTYFSNKSLVYRTKFNYSHPQHPRWHTQLVDEKGEVISEVAQTPVEISEDLFRILTKDYPAPYLTTNVLLVPKEGQTPAHSAWTQRTHKFRYLWTQYDIRRKREALWELWRSGKISGVTVRVLDEQFLRDEPALKPYWRYRDLGQKEKAVAFLLSNRAINESMLRVPDTPLTRSHFHIRFGDLLVLGCGGDSSDLSARESEEQQRMSAKGQELLHVLSLDSGTWPTGGGGVGSCRRDLIDHLKRVRWTVIAEIASADLVQRDYQVERHVDKITYIPLWDVDFGSPNENIFRREAFTDLRRKTARTTSKVIRSRFVPLIRNLVRFSATPRLPSDRMSEAEDIFVQLYLYFQKYDWLTSWHHKYAQGAWVEEWLKQAQEKLADRSALLCELPTLKELNMLYLLVVRLLLILTAEIPKELPTVHSSHHGIQAILGVISKRLYDSSFTIWDHGILWRERLFALCEADNMPRFVQVGFIGLTHLVARIAYARADFITPCTRVQNVDWEIWIGGDGSNDDAARVAIQTKVSAVVNGMDISKFRVAYDQEKPQPTAVMLSHISPVKDIKNAILAADYIVNRLKFKPYQLLIYGSKEKDPLYAAECSNLINALNLTGHVHLEGLGNPAVVLCQGHLFLNSSISEGLPLALGEAGLCGLPVVCTDVGGSREVITDMESMKAFGRAVPPAVPKQLAIAQLQVLAMTDGLEQIVDPAKQKVTLDELLQDASGQALEERIMLPQVRDSRRALGGLLRTRVIENFSIARYWREHEQVLMLGKLQQDVRFGTMDPDPEA